MRRAIAAAIAGTIFGLGLAVSGMINPAKVLGFLDFTGDWDPSLALVMGGAVAMTLFFPRMSFAAKNRCSTPRFTFRRKPILTRNC